MTHQATVADVLAELANLSSYNVAFDNAVTAFANPGGTFGQAMDIHKSVIKATDATDKVTTDIQTLPIPISIDDNTAIFNAITNFGPPVLHALNELVSKKHEFDTLAGVTDRVRQDLYNIQVGVIAFGDALILRTPDSELERSLALKKVFDDALVTAISAYN